jgi:hypothetical protein
MSEDEYRKGQAEDEQDEVEAHRRHPAANDEGQAEGDDDVEAHRRHPAANDEGDDDVEAHRFRAGHVNKGA